MYFVLEISFSIFGTKVGYHDRLQANDEIVPQIRTKILLSVPNVAITSLSFVLHKLFS
jgi:hypothetical protein